MLSANKKFCSQLVIDKSEHSAVAQLQWVKSKDGFEVPIYDGVRVHSTYNVAREAERVASLVADGELIVAVGFACGYHLQNVSKSHKILVVVNDYPLFATVSEHIEFTFLQNVLIIDKTELYEQLYLALSQHSARVKVITSDYLNNCDRQTVSELSEIVMTTATNINTELNTIRRFGFVWQRNINKNIKHYFDGRLNFDDLVIKNKIILVCGAGFSLTQHISFIKNHRELFYIAATDTSALVLVRAGVVPDSIFSFDAQNISYKHFFALNNINSDVRLFVDFTSPINFSCQNVQTTLLFSAHPYREIFRKAGWNVLDFDSGCGNIGWATANFFLTYMPNVPIITVGLDFAYYKHYTYARHSYLSDTALAEQSYFATQECFDAKLFYRSRIVQTDGDWNSTSLLKSYATVANRDIPSLSDSPFCRQISYETVLDSLRECCGTVKFEFAPISRLHFEDVRRECLTNDKTAELPFRMWQADKMSKK